MGFDPAARHLLRRPPFFTPASGNTHIAAIMKIAVATTKLEKPWRIGDPLQ